MDPATRSTVLPAGELGTGDDAAHDFSSEVECTNGRRIVAERPMYFDYKGEWTGGHDVVGSDRRRQRLLLRGGHLPPRLRPLPLHPEPRRRGGGGQDNLHEGGRHTEAAGR